MAGKRSIGEMIFDIFNYIFMALILFATLYPFLYIAFASFSDPYLLEAHQGFLVRPVGFSLASFKAVFGNRNILMGYRNTLIYVVLGTSLNLLMTSLGAYVLSRNGPCLKNIFTFLFVFTMFFSGGLIPFYLIVQGLKLADTMWAVILPPAVNTYNLIIMRTAFAGVPPSMEESARIDGAGDVTILFRIIIPLCMPVVAVMILFYGVYHWNAWVNASIFFQKRTLYPLQLFLREILITSNTDSMTTGASSGEREYVSQGIKYATIIVATIPILCVYPFLQRFFNKGIMIGAVKE
ncbi:MAG: carbohydrate ABC transporter permease [Clostridiales bacterium]|nr:carbohydrate ABC transporter permease [Clostridiales bacterium]